MGSMANRPWSEQLRIEWERSFAFAVGIFGRDGTVVFANEGMGALLELAQGNPDPARYFQTPPFARLAQSVESEEPVFTGLLTIGNPQSAGVTLQGRAFHRHGQVLVACEPDAPAMARVNRELATLLEELSVLQRELLKEKRALTEANQELSRLNREKDSWLGTVAHDLRNPLATIQLLSQVLETPGLSPARMSAAGAIIQQALQRTVTLIDDLLDAAAIERGTLELKREVVAIDDFVDSVLVLNQPLAAAKGITLAREVDPAARTGWFDPKRIEQVVSNLISNAVKFSPPNTRAIVGVKRSDRELEVWVQDEGQGIQPGELGAAFGEFSRTSTRPTAGERSTGLGLAICKRIVALHGGTIHAESEPGRGSRFYFRLPLEPTNGRAPQRG
jgi:signal transduction histidine kinase